MSPRTSRTLPLFEPILLTPRREPFDDPAWLFEPKYDGYRGLLYVTRQGCHFQSKRGNILKRFEQLCYWVREELPVEEASSTVSWWRWTARVARTSGICWLAVETSTTPPSTLSGYAIGISAACHSLVGSEA